MIIIAINSSSFFIIIMIIVWISSISLWLIPVAGSRRFLGYFRKERWFPCLTKRSPLSVAPSTSESYHDDNNDDNDTDLMEFLHSHHLQTSSNREKMNCTAWYVTVIGLVVQGQYTSLSLYIIALLMYFTAHFCTVTVLYCRAVLLFMFQHCTVFHVFWCWNLQ